MSLFFYIQGQHSILMLNIKQGRIHGSISHARWAGALMEVRSLFGLNSAVKKNALRTDGLTDGWTDGRTDRTLYRVTCM